MNKEVMVEYIETVRKIVELSAQLQELRKKERKLALKVKNQVENIIAAKQREEQN